MAAQVDAKAGARARAASHGALKKAAAPAAADAEADAGRNWSTAMGEGSLFPLLAVFLCPVICNLLAFITTDGRLPSPSISDFAAFCGREGAPGLLQALLPASALEPRAWSFLAAFMLLAYVLCMLPGPVRYGPVTATGHIPEYVDNGMLHCVLFSVVFIGCSSMGLGLFDLGIIYDIWAPLVVALNTFGLTFCLFLYAKGLRFPTTKDCGTTGRFLVDYYWGTELYPKVLGVDVKRFINCRFSMTFWMLSGFSFAHRSYTVHGEVDYGLLFSAISQYVYLAKFFLWEIGYMCSIDIIVDRAGFYETWGCLVWVPSVYTLHSRVMVRAPSQLGFLSALAIFIASLAGVFTNFWADKQREWTRKSGGNTTIWGSKPELIEARYTAMEGGKPVAKTSLLLASGFWGVARHFHYAPELLAAWSWCLLANPLANGLLPLFYAVFLTMLLIHRAKRDEERCILKYGDDYKRYAKLVPWRIVPGIY